MFMDWTAFMVGFSIMALASLAIYASGSKQPPSRHHTLLHATVQIGRASCRERVSIRV